MKKGDVGIHAFSLLLVLGALALFVPPGGSSAAFLERAAAALSMALVCVSGALLVKSPHDENLSAKLSFMIVAASLLLHFAYVLYTPYHVRQHDLLGAGGHLEYIMYFVQNGLSLPSFAPQQNAQFYHPPLLHLISALWVKFSLLLGFSKERAVENLQALSFFYSGASVIIFYSILRRITTSCAARNCALMLFAMFPAFVLFSGALNNDMLLFALSLAAIYCAVRWYMKPSARDAAACALVFSAAALTKASALVMFPAFALLFAQRWAAERRAGAEASEIRRAGPAARAGASRAAAQFALFSAIALPISFSWHVYNLLRFGMPIGYVMRGSADHAWYLGAVPAFDRLFGTSGGALSSLFFVWDKSEYNMFVAAVKSSAFGEFTLFESGSLGWKLCAALLALCAVVFAASALCSAAAPFVCRGRARAFAVFFAALYFTFMASYIRFCFGWPHVYTQNFRYIFIGQAAAILSFSMVLTRLGRGSGYEKHQRLERACAAFCAAFALLSAAVYAMPAFAV